MNLMATPPSDDTRTMFRLLGDREWHNYAQIKAAIAATVPPGRALRKYQERLRQNRDLRNDPNTEILRSEDDQIKLGAAACAQITMTSWKGKGVISRGEGPDKEIKIKPGFSSWGIEAVRMSEEQDPGKAGEGYTDLPPRDSEPSEPSAAGAQGASEPEPERQPAPEPRSPEPVAVEEDVLPAASDTGSVLLDGSVPPGPWVPHSLPEPMAAPAEGSSQYVTNVPVWSCPECFMAVTDEAEHHRWHREIKSGTEHPEMALLDQEAMRTLLGDVTRQALDDFQVGMQDWFEARFAELERQIFILRGLRPDRVSWSQKP